VYEYVYEYGKKPRQNALPTYFYTYSYTRISSCRVVQQLAKKLSIVSRQLNDRLTTTPCSVPTDPVSVGN
jgi:hypothetical protein